MAIVYGPKNRGGKRPRGVAKAKGRMRRVNNKGKRKGKSKMMLP